RSSVVICRFVQQQGKFGDMVAEQMEIVSQSNLQSGGELLVLLFAKARVSIVKEVGDAMSETGVGDGLLLPVVPGNKDGVVGDELLEIIFHEKSLLRAGMALDDYSTEIDRLV